jgi:uncharacterized membrane protein
MTRTVTHLFDDYTQAMRAVAALEEVGFSSSEISLVSRYRNDGKLADEASGTTKGATVGALAGGGTGLLAALGMIAIPGIGPLVAAGVFATTLVGLAGGTLVGGLVGALTDYGVNEKDAHVYSEGVRRGGTLVTVRADDTRAAQAERILNEQRPVDIGARRKHYADAGWSAYDPKAPGYTAEQIRKERELYGRQR